MWRIRFSKISSLRMVLKRLKLHQFFMVWHELFPSHKHAKLHHLETPLDNTSAGSKSDQGDQIVHGVFCQTFTKFAAKLQLIYYSRICLIGHHKGSRK